MCICSGKTFFSQYRLMRQLLPTAPSPIVRTLIRRQGAGLLTGTAICVRVAIRYGEPVGSCPRPPTA